MKKNRIMRVFSVLLALTLISTCAISGTFAKYVTRAEGKDSARVAKWGVMVSMDGDSVFSTQYAAEDDTYLQAGGEYSVVAYEEYDLDEDGEVDRVVAPGTKLEGLNATVTGKPEVAARYTLEATGIKDIVLPAGTYTDFTKPVEVDENGNVTSANTFELDNDYAPIKWNLVITKGNTEFNVAEELYNAIPANYMAAAEALGMTKEGCSIFSAVAILQKVAGSDGYKQIVENALSQVVSGGRNFQLEADQTAGTVKLSYDFDPNKDMGFTFSLSWEWAYENGEELKDEDGNGTGIYEFDAADTFLGNLIAAKLDNETLPVADGADDGSNATLEIAATFTATAVQID